MSGAFAWLNDLMTWLGRFVPRLLLVPPTHRGVRFGPRGGVREVGPGLLVYWPITHNILQIPVTTQSVQFCGQILLGDDSGALLVPRVSMCSTAIQFRVVDPVKAAMSALNLYALIDNRASAAIARHFNAKVPADEWVKMAAADLDGAIAAYGINLERLDLTQAGSGIAVKNISDWSHSDQAEGKHALSV